MSKIFSNLNRSFIKRFSLYLVYFLLALKFCCTNSILALQTDKSIERMDIINLDYIKEIIIIEVCVLFGITVVLAIISVILKKRKNK